MNLVYLSLAWVLGIFLGSRFSLQSDLLISLMAVSAFIGISYIKYRNKNILMAGLCLLLLSGGMLRFSSLSEGDQLESYRGFYTVQGIVSDSPQTGRNSTALRIECCRIGEEGDWQEVSGNLQVYASKYPGFDSRTFPYYHYGDLIEFQGILRSPQTIEKQSDFDYAAYLASNDIYSVMYSPTEIVLIDTGYKCNPMQWIHQLRRSISSSLKNTISEPQCAISQAMLIGERSSITDQMREDFAQAGASHILAISGLHVAILTGIALSAGTWIFGRRYPTYILVAMGVLWLYVTLSGMSPSGVRAAIMGSLWLWAIWLGRQKSTFTAISFAAAIMLAYNPKLLDNLSFQLSFAAMSGIIFITPIFQMFGHKLWKRKQNEIPATLGFVINSFAVTLGAIMATLPLIAFHFDYVSLMSLPATFLILPAVPPIIVGSAVTGLTGLFAPGVAHVIGWIVWLFTTYVSKTVEMFAAIPFASVDVHVNAPMVCSYYGILVAFLWVPGNYNRIMGWFPNMKSRVVSLPEHLSNLPFKWIVIPLLVITVLVWTAAVTALDHRLHVYVLDVGEGDAILIQKENQQVLIDGGPDPNKLLNEIGNRMPYWDRTIELVILTHADADHITGLIEVMRRYEVDKVVTNGRTSDCDLYNEWSRLVEEREIEHIVADAGQQIVMDDDISMTVLHPNQSEVEYGNTNTNHLSIVTRLEYESFSMLFTGDIEMEAEKLLLQGNGRLRSNVLKIAHHGADSSSSLEFLRAVDPQFTVISCGANNRFGHPSSEVIERISMVVDEGRNLTTTTNGTIEFVSNGDTLWINHEN